jgi:nucleotide-binding universal stress UspA family protein
MQEEAVNLLLLGMPRSRPSPVGAIGSTTDSLILGAPCDVAVAQLLGMKESLLRIGVVLGPWTSRGLPELARAVLGVGGHIAFLGLAADAASGETLRADAEKAVAECLASGIEASYQELGPPSQATLKGIAAKDFDLLVLGSPEPKAFARAIPLVRQVRRLTCPVVVFRPAPSKES